MALSKNEPFAFKEGEYNDLPVLASTKVYEGAVVSVTAAGFAKGYAGTDTIFGGIAQAEANNSAGASGDINVQVRRGQFYGVVTLSSAADADAGDAIYASADDTFTKTSTSNLEVGKIVQVMATDKVLVQFNTGL